MQKSDSNSAPASSGPSAYDLLAWLELNKKPVIWAAVGVLAAVVALYVINWQRNRSEAAASAALLALRLDADPSGKPAAQAADFLRVAGAHASTDAAARAQLLAAVDQYTEGKYPEARRQFEEFLRAHPENSFAATAQFGLATALDALDQKDEALAAYQAIASRYPDDVLVSRAKINAAALYEAKGQPEQALRLLEELSRPGAAPAGATEAAMRKQQLLQRHPSLVKTNPVPVVVAPTATEPANTNLNTAPPAGAPKSP